MRSVAVLLLAAAGCAPAPKPPVEPAPPVGPTKAAVLSVLDSLERTFQNHWGAVEKSPEFAVLGPAHVPWLREIADANGAHALLALRVLERRAPAEKFSVEAKAILYSSALEREEEFARWGMITRNGFLPGVYGSELLALKEAAVPYLRKALFNRRRARVTGGEGERANRVQGDRVCDYAWVLLATMLDRPLVYHEDPRFRDPQIREMDVWLDRRN